MKCNAFDNDRRVYVDNPEGERINCRRGLTFEPLQGRTLAPMSGGVGRTPHG